MNISEILNLVIDPRPEYHKRAVTLLFMDEALFSQCQTFININEGYAGYSTDEMRTKWETRIVPLYMRLRKALILSDIRSEGVAVYWKDLKIGEASNAVELQGLIGRFTFGMVAGLNPSDLVES